MMTDNKNPWDEIEKPVADYNVLLVEGSGRIRMFWGKDTDGRFIFIVELEGEHRKEFENNGTSIQGIKTDLRAFKPAGSQGLVLTLEQKVDKDLFFGLCETLVAAVQPIEESGTALAVALTHIKRWKAFMAGNKRGILTPSEVRGLFAELQFLRLLASDPLSESDAVRAWCGPEGLNQDFVFGDRAVEIKALTGRERSRVKISSEDQLESVCDNLFLMVFRLTEQNDSSKSLSLNDLVGLIEGGLTDVQAAKELMKKLAKYGYVELREYDRPKILVSNHQSYRVVDGFPRIVRSGLPTGVSHVGYSIALEEINGFKCDVKEIWET